MDGKAGSDGFPNKSVRARRNHGRTPRLWAQAAGRRGSPVTKMEKTVGQEQVWKWKSKEFTFGHDKCARSLRHHVTTWGC